jgi:hypothetical protein
MDHFRFTDNSLTIHFASYITEFLASREHADKNMLLTMKSEFCHDSSRYRRQKLYI